MRNSFSNPTRTLCCKIIAIILLVCFQAGNAYGWGKTGHRLVARIAAAELTPEAADEIARILQNESMASASIWADVVKSARPETGHYHYVNFAKAVPGEALTIVGDPQDNVVAAIDRFQDVLVGNLISDVEKREALQFLIHFVGDIHQPMHCAPEGDAGGNQVKVSYRGRQTNLHSLWDTNLIETTELTEDQYYTALCKEFRDAELNTASKGTARDWAEDSHNLAVMHAYQLPDDLVLTERYYESNIRVVNRQLMRAGLRLADILNRIFTKNRLAESVRPDDNHFLTPNS